MSNRERETEWYVRLKWSSSDRMWWGRYRLGNFDVGLTGSEEVPSLERREALHFWVLRVDELRAAAAQAISGRVLHGRSGDRQLQVEHVRCDAEDIDVVRLSSAELGTPGAIELEFVTGYPDGYFLYMVRFQDGTPIDSRFGFW